MIPADRAFVRNYLHKVRCDYCHKPVTQLREVLIGKHQYKLHDLREIKVAQENYDKNIQEGITPTILNDQENDAITESNDDGIGGDE